MPQGPLIGIAPHLLQHEKKALLVATHEKYIEAIQRAGGLPIVLSPEVRHIPRLLSLLDGLLLTGGGDIDPRHFGRKRGKAPLKLSPERRTRFELALVRAFVRAQKPLLGICLGCQTINVALGGTLILDLPLEMPAAKNHRKGFHPIQIERSSRLNRIVRRGSLRVNTFHHQAIGRVAPKLQVCASSPDGVIEAVEGRGRAFLLGIQWHPEELRSRAESTRLFSSFVGACQSQMRRT